LFCSLPPPSLLPCVPSSPPITLISLPPLPSKRPLRPLSSSPRQCSLILDPIAPTPTPMPASPSRPCLSRLRCPLRRQRPPTHPPPSSSTLFDCCISSNFDRLSVNISVKNQLILDIHPQHHQYLNRNIFLSPFTDRPTRAVEGIGPNQAHGTSTMVWG
jgi:hypothetical protein